MLWREPCSDKVQAALAGAAISAVSFSEVLAKAAEVPKGVEAAKALLRGLQLPIIAFDEQQADIAVGLRPITRSLGLSLGDRCCLAPGPCQSITCHDGGSQLGGAANWRRYPGDTLSGANGAFREFRTGGEREATDLYEMRKELDQAIERNKEKARGRNGSGTQKSKLEREDIERAKAAIESAGASLGIDIYARVPPKPFPFMEEVSGEKEGEGFRWRSERYAAAVATIAGTIKDERDKALLGRLWKCVKPVDKVTRCVTEEPRGALMQVLNFLHNHPDASAHLVVFEVYNMAGMNNRLGHDGCDKAIGNFVQQIATENIPAAQVASYHPPGPYIYTIILGKKNDDIMGIIQETCTRVHEYAVRSGLSDLENPRYPGKENRGARFIVEALELGRSYVMHPELPLDAVREQAIRNKNERLCFRGEGIGKPETGIDYQAQPVKLQPSLPGELLGIRGKLRNVIPATMDTLPSPGNRQGGKWSGKERSSP